MTQTRTPSPLFRSLILLSACWLLLVACGGDQTVDTAADPVDTTSDSSPDDPVDAPARDDGGSADLRQTTANPEMISPVHAVIDSVESIDESTIGVRFWNGAEPCARADVTVTESDDAVTVRLDTGLHPDVAAMTCVAGQFLYEIPVTLAAPLGDRDISYDDPPGTAADDELPATDHYVGLTLADAEALAADEGLELRITRQDDEHFAVTEDFRFDRVNVELDDGVVTLATAG